MGRIPQKSTVYRLLLCFIVVMIGRSYLHAQLGNEWIDYDQQFWKFPIVEDGLYSITYDELLSSGFPVGSVDPNNIQLFGRGQNWYMELIGGGDGTFDEGDEILFYGLANDGWLDAEVYEDPSIQTNPYYSLFNDTANYFISIAPSINGFVTSNVNSTGIGEELEYVRYQSTRELHSEYLFGKQDANGISLPFYEEAEGWFDQRFAKGQTRSLNISTPNVYQEGDAPPSVIQSACASASLAQGNVNHHLQFGYGSGFTLLADTTYYGYQLNKFEFEVPTSTINDGTTVVTHRSIDDLGVAADYHAVAYIQITYPRNLDFPEGTFYFEPFDEDGIENAHLSIDAFNGEQPDLFVFENGIQQRIIGNNSEDPNVYRFDLDYSSIENKRLLLLQGASIQSVTGIKPVTQTGYFTDYASEPLDSAFVIITHPQFWPSAQNYANYRELQGMEVMIADVTELYDQYAAGISKHPLALRKFCNHLLTSWTSAPSHLFIIGKSVHEMNVSATTGARNSAGNYAKNTVPSWGYPTSDLPITSGLNGTNMQAAIPTGRLAVQSNQQVLGYLNKVVEYEAQVPAEWMKNILHFGGGGNEYEQNLFKNYLNSYKATAQDTCFGAKVYSFFKDTNEPIQIGLSDSIQLLINQGASMMTFFGHASSTGFDVNIDSPDSYDNQGKYPLLLGNSCYTGNIHLPSSLSTSENFVLEPNAGVIGFIAKGDLGLPSYLNLWTSSFYRKVFQEDYGKSLGQCMQSVVEELQNASENLYLRNVTSTVGLHGDPSIVLNSFSRPDMKVIEEQIFFEPEDVSTQLDSFKVNVELSNLGKAINNSFGVELIRHFPDGSDSSIVQSVDGILASKVVTFTLPVDRFRGVGTNTFDVFVDYPAVTVDELENVANNIVMGRSLLITSGNLVPIWPFDLSVLPESPTSLKASTGDPIIENSTFVVELDTSRAFSSPWLMTTNLNSVGGVVEWELPTSLSEDKVYYWRCSPLPSGETDFDWRYSSFEVQANKRGWGQSHVDQFDQNRFSQLELDTGEEEYAFFTGEVSIKCEVYGQPANAFEVNATRYQIDLAVMDYAGCGSAPALHVAVMDSISLIPWETNYDDLFPQNDFGNLMDCSNSRNRTEKYFIFRQTDTDEMAGFVDMMENHVPDGNYVLIYTWKYANYNGWESVSPETFDVFENLGATTIGAAQDSVPFIFFCKKGYPETVTEIYGTDIGEFIELNATMTGTSGFGSMTSSAVGPSSIWESLEWKLEDNESDSTSIHLLSGELSNSSLIYEEVVVGENESSLIGETDLQNSSILKVQPKFADVTELTPAQINYWRLIADHAPEAALNASIGYYFSSDSLAEGETLEMALAIENISEFDMDSLLVHYWIETSDLQRIDIPYMRQDSLRKGDVLLDTLTIETLGLSGYNTLFMEVNPRNDGSLDYDQMEQHHFNNIAQWRIFVDSDRINPVLDVTFDGRHILNGDIVSARPEILITLLDENPYLLLSEDADTSNFKLFVTDPLDVQRPIYFNNVNEIMWIPSTSNQEKFKIIYTPEYIVDGTYRLLVQAQDKSGNSSGEFDYEIDFEIILQSTITEVLNYPNPFSTRTQFVFTLTGTQVPDYVRIQIMTITGSVVREITTSEIGPLTIGRNVTDFYWDGKDQFGDQLANGIYLYKVTVMLNGQEVQQTQTAASKFFKKGFGKMYLLR